MFAFHLYKRQEIRKVVMKYRIAKAGESVFTNTVVKGYMIATQTVPDIPHSAVPGSVLFFVLCNVRSS